MLQISSMLRGGKDQPQAAGLAQVVDEVQPGQIGEGGFGTVWMAEQQEPVRRRLALKGLSN